MRHLSRNITLLVLVAAAILLVAAVRPSLAVTAAVVPTDLKLTYACGNYFRLQNTSTSEATVVYSVYRTSETGTMVMPARASSLPYSELYFKSTQTGSVLVTLNGARVSERPNGGKPCATVADTGSDGAVFTWPIMPIHAALTKDGNVLAWGRLEDGTIPTVWDAPNTSSSAFTSVSESDNLFCAGQTQMADGRIFLAGGQVAGTTAQSNYLGGNWTYIFDPSTTTWSKKANMLSGRWYPTTVTLPNGDILVVGGTDANRVYVAQPEVFQVASSSYRELTTAQFVQPYYPRLLLAPNGKVFQAGENTTSRWLDFSGTGSWSIGPKTQCNCTRDYGPAIMYDTGQVIYIGGGGGGGTPLPPVQASVELIDLRKSSPQWKFTNPMHFARRQHNATIMFDGKIVVTGGTSTSGFNDGTNVVYRYEEWNPADSTWKLLATGKKARLYHSEALLLLDGSVIVMGGGQPNANHVVGDQFNGEIYLPPYLYNPDGTRTTYSRPVITSVSSSVSYGGTFTVSTPSPNSVGKVRLIRLGTVTHSMNVDQRVLLPSFSVSGGQLRVTAPSSALIAPLGYYMVVLVSKSGVPSLAKTIRVGS